jgi:hypothetical protein
MTPAQLQLLKEILVRAGFGVITATNAAEALQSFKRTSITLVIADHMLGGKTGSKLAAEIKALAPAMPIVLHSAYQPEFLGHIDVFIRKGERRRSSLIRYRSSSVPRCSSVMLRGRRSQSRLPP